MTNDAAPKSKTTLGMIFLVCVALVWTATWVISSRNWQARSLALAALVVLGVAGVHLLTAPRKTSLFKR